MRRVLHPEARNELVDAFAFYKEQAGPMVATAFLAEFERVILLLESNPGFGTPATGSRRSYPLRRFPYSVVYRAVDDELRILVVGHQHRKPGLGYDRS